MIRGAARAERDVLLVATRSNDKLREIRAILAATTRADILSLDDAGIAPDPAEDAIEVHDTFLANAHAKAAWFAARTRMTTIADDSGIAVDALDGRPGVRSKRFAPDRSLRGADLDDANNRHLLHLLRDVPAGRRGAHYTCAAVLHTPAGHRRAAVGTVSGLILDAPRGSAGFGYDPLFLDPVTGRSFGETDPAVKNTRSHRARAFRALATLL